MVRVLYFAWLRERMGCAEEQLEIPPGVATVGDLAAWLRARNAKGEAAFAELSTVRAAVNQVFALPPAPFADGDEVAFFPPVTGG
ncbi:molybdopterin converting factor subunit 1 [Acidisphaera sp. L21]|uniref:molybdopterin converting factor subunit 1 n=1 Tax=Acidisphaera sp. L21 TaxID=1641851 RepID=UPI00131B374C|nr:molybdopterin converting factor subunit 1 [Acidisphaera sp. L21]